jgi:hypothetical protein
LPYSEIENRLDAALNIVPNDWRAVEARLKARGILSAGHAVAEVRTLEIK